MTLADLWTAVKAWRDAKCSSPAPSWAEPGDYCEGDNHLENCAVELARQDVLAVHNKIAEPTT